MIQLNVTVEYLKLKIQDLLLNIIWGQTRTIPVNESIVNIYSVYYVSFSNIDIDFGHTDLQYAESRYDMYKEIAYDVN